MIGQCHCGQPGRGRARDDLLRRQRAIGRRRVHVQVGERPSAADVFDGAQR
jgi:hypothetical protein